MVRIKERYLLVNILYPSEIDTKPNIPDIVVLNQPTSDKLTPQALLRAIRAEVASFFGDYGSGALEGGSLQGSPNSPFRKILARLMRPAIVKYLSPATSTFILRIHRQHFRLLWTVLTLMESVPIRDGKPCVFRVVHVSGTIRRAEEEAMRRARNMMLAAKGEGTDKESTSLEALLGEPKRTRGKTISSDFMDVEDDEDASDEDMDYVNT